MLPGSPTAASQVNMREDSSCCQWARDLSLEPSFLMCPSLYALVKAGLKWASPILRAQGYHPHYTSKPPSCHLDMNYHHRGVSHLSMDTPDLEYLSWGGGGSLACLTKVLPHPISTNTSTSFPINWTGISSHVKESRFGSFTCGPCNALAHIHSLCGHCLWKCLTCLQVVMVKDWGLQADKWQEVRKSQVESKAMDGFEGQDRTLYRILECTQEASKKRCHMDWVSGIRILNRNSGA